MKDFLLAMAAALFKKRVAIFTALVIWNFAAGASLASTPLESCVKKTEQNLGSYEQMMCIYRLSTRGPQERKAARARLNKLRQAYPDNLRLDIIQAHTLRNTKAQEAIASYREIAKQAVERGELDVEVIARINLGDLLLVQQRDAEGIESLRQASLRGQSSSSPVTRMRVHLAQVYHAVRLSLDLGEIHAKLFAIDHEELASLPYSLQRLALFARVQAATELLATGPALQDAAYLRKLAQEQNDAFTLALADYVKGSALYEQLSSSNNSQIRQEAIGSLLSALRAFEAQGQTINEINTIFSLAELTQGAKGGHSAASAWSKRCEELLKTKLAPSSRLLCLLALSQLSRNSDPKAALRYARKGHRLSGDSTKVWERITAWQQLMRRSWDPSHLQRSRLIAQAGLQVIEEIRGLQGQATARGQVFARWVVDYHWYISKLIEVQAQDSRALQEAFWIAERSRARVLWDELNERENPSRGRGWQDIKPSTQELELRKYLSEIWDLTPASAEALNQFQRALREKWQRDEDPKFASAAKVQAQLQPHQAMVTFQLGPSQARDGEPLGKASAFILTSEELQAVSFDWDEQAIESASSIVRAFVERGSPEQVPLTDQLREMVLEPIRARLPAAVTELIIVAEGQLQGLPWFVLDDSYSYSFVPSASIWLHLKESHEPAFSLKGVALVDPTPSEHPSIERSLSCDEDLFQESDADTRQMLYRALPHSRRELKSIAAVAGEQVRLLFGAQSSIEGLYQSWTDQDRFLHLSAHSVLSASCPERSGILFAADESHPDGLLSMDEISKLDLNGAVVVLGGCSTALGKRVAGEGLLSIARAFQRAGAQAVVASLWPLKDQEAADFMDALYPAIRSESTLSGAVRRAQLELRLQGQSTQAYAGFVVLGHGSVRATGPWKSQGSGAPWIWLALVPVVSLLIYLFYPGWRRWREAQGNG